MNSWYLENCGNRNLFRKCGRYRLLRKVRDNTVSTSNVVFPITVTPPRPRPGPPPALTDPARQPQTSVPSHILLCFTI